MTSLMQQPKALHEAWADWLSGFAWSHAVTLTAREPTSRPQLLRAFNSGFIRRLERRVHAVVPYFSAVEETAEGFPHIHALLGGTADLAVRDIEARWPLGFSRTRLVIYDVRKGAAHYFSKSLTEASADDYSLSRQMPPLLTTREPTRTVSGSAIDAQNTQAKATMRTEVVYSTEAMDFAAWARSYLRHVIELDASDMRAAA